jgi:urease accessory protein
MNRRNAEAQRRDEMAAGVTGQNGHELSNHCATVLSISAPLRLSGKNGLGGENDFLVWQVMESAFPTGGFAHSAGLEAAWQHGEVRGRQELLGFIEASLEQLGHAALPLVTAAFAQPEKLAGIDQLCDAFTTNHVANRASRAQGRAFLSALTRIFPGATAPAPPVFAHFAPVFGAGLRRFEFSAELVARMFCFNHLRSILAAAVRLNIVGPMEAQTLQHRLTPVVEQVRERCQSLSLEDLAHAAPLLDLWQGAQDRLYSRLFQS